MVGCKDYLALLELAERERGGGGWLTDERRELGPKILSGPALSCSLYNPTLRQVVTGHADSSVSLWDVETGKRRLQISNAHGDDELTCMALDSSHRRLITGASNGTIKVFVCTKTFTLNTSGTQLYFTCTRKFKKSLVMKRPSCWLLPSRCGAYLMALTCTNWSLSPTLKSLQWLVSMTTSCWLWGGVSRSLSMTLLVPR